MEKAKITHYISPHLFYFKYELSQEEMAYIEILEDAIVAHVKQQRISRPLAEYHFKVGDLVSLYYLPWERFIRAKVLEVLEKFSSTTDYIVWAHDYGFPVQTDKMFLMPLPDTFKELESLVHRGCLADVIPVNVVCEENQQKVMKRATEWSAHTCEQLASLLDKREIFVKIIDANNESNDSLRFCKVQIEIADNECVDVIDLLESFQFGVRVKSHEFARLLTLQGEVDWVKNDGTANFRINEPDDKLCKSPVFLDDWEKQPPVDEEIIEVNLAEHQDPERCFDLLTPNEQQPKQFPRICFAHSSIVLSKRNYEEVFHAEMCAQIERMGITSLNILQKYSWPHLQRGNSLFVVSPSGSGKKWCYLPVICNVVEIGAKNLTEESVLPLTIVVTANKLRSMEIAMICRQLLRNIQIKTKDYLVSTGCDMTVPDSLQFVGILILTTKDVSKMIATGAFERLCNDKRLHAIVLNNIIEILQHENEAFLGNLATHCSAVQQSVKADQRLIQIIVTANEWHEQVFQMILNTTYYPLLLMSDFLEAAIYAKCPIVTKVCRTADKKLSTIAAFIQKHQSLRMVVVCSNKNEALVVDKALNRSGLCAFSYTTSEYAEELLKRWQKLISNEVLICTDGELPKLYFNKVHKLVHYSLPAVWSNFTERFSVLKDAYHNFIASGLTTNENVYRDEQVSSFIALDTDDLQLLPQLMTFLIKHKQPVSEKLLDFAAKATDPIHITKDLPLVEINADIIAVQSTFKIRWTKLITLTEVLLGDIEDLSNFYVRLTSTRHVEKLAALEQLICEKTPNASCSINELQQKGYYLVSYMDKLARAQLQQISHQGRNRLYRFFLVDYGSFVDIPDGGEKTIKDVYPITRDVIEFTACQALHCKPAGFEMKSDFSLHLNLEPGVQLYAYPCAQEGQLVNNLHVNSCRIKLFQYEDNVIKTNCALINSHY